MHQDQPDPPSNTPDPAVKSCGSFLRARRAPNAWDSHIHTFDLARALAALAVVLFHWQEFAIPGLPLPFMPWLNPFYRFGAFAVPFFFALSGFVFTWLYADAIRDRRVELWPFAIGRVSRLYPLFLATFLIAAGALPLCRAISDFPFSYLYADGYHAGLSLLMLNGWGFERGFSFNGPSWSVSTEMFLYAAFFIMARSTRLTSRASLVMIAIGIAITPFSVHIAGGITQFFAGSIAYRAFTAWTFDRKSWRIFAALATSTACLIAYYYEYKSGFVLSIIRYYLPTVANLDVRYQIIRDLAFSLLLFPGVVFLLAAANTVGSVERLFNRPLCHWAGNVSYAIYLCHFPLMMIAAITIASAGLAPSTFYKLCSILLFLSILLLCSHAVYNRFERPAMRALRGRMIASLRNERSVP